VYRWVLDSGVPCYDADGYFAGYIGSCIDITDRKRGEVLLATLQDITAALAGAATLEDVAEVVVNKALAVFGGSIASVVMLSEDETQANVIRRVGLPEEINREHLTMDINSNFPIVVCIREQRTIWLENEGAYLEAYPHMTDIQAKTGTQAVVCLPLVIKNKTIGALGLAFKTPVELTSTEKGFMTALAQHCAQAMERAQLSERARDGAAIAERHRLARDLHDSISQSLFAITMTAEALPMTWLKKPDTMEQHLERLLLLGQGAHAAMRAMLLELRPDQLVIGSISDQFEGLAAMLRGRKNMNVSLEVSPNIDEPRLPPNVHEALYRISQEALNHIVTHSTATLVNVQLVKEADTIRLIIQENGNPTTTDDTITPMLNMPTMRERAEKIGAKFTFASTPVHGSTLKVEWRPED
jgi:signal transduction histidine kinase